MKSTDLFAANYNAKESIVVNQGGTWSGKTYAILQTLLVLATETPKAVITIAGQDMPNLKAGALRDFANILEENPNLKAWIWKHNKSDHIYYFRNGAKVEFKSYENWQDAKSGKRQFLFINEANGFSFEVAEQLILRTTIRTFIDFNPDAEFWVHEHYKNKPDVVWFFTDHRHNPHVPEKTRERIEDLKNKDLELWKVYARGMTGKVEGLIYRNWEITDEFPTERFIDSCYGLDFGFNHPTALIEVGWTETEYYARELIYESGLITPTLAERMEALNLGTKQIFADAARPDTISELCQAGFNVIPADKTVKDGINAVKAKPLKIYQSPGMFKEIKAYRWKVDRNGKPVDEPVKVNDDAMDATRYAIYNGTKGETLDYEF